MNSAFAFELFHERTCSGRVVGYPSLTPLNRVMEGSPVYPADAVILARGDGFRHGCGPVVGFGPIRCSVRPSGQFTCHTFIPCWSRMLKILSLSSHYLAILEIIV